MSKPEEIRETVLNLHHQAIPIRRISRILKISRNKVRRIIRDEGKPKKRRPSRYEDILPVIQGEFRRCEGNAVRIQENLQCEYGEQIPYSTLTKLVRNMDLRENQTRKRSGSYDYKPGSEAQLDTSPHQVILNGKKVTAQCAGFILGYCRRAFVQYYPSFTRLEAKAFLKEAQIFNDGSVCECIIDNTCVIVAHGHGPSAQIAPEMEFFGKIFGMRFVPHAIGHADRKALVERLFSYVENNFLKGRTFSGWQDLNLQARQWCIRVANQKFKRSLGMSADEAYITEKRFLRPLPLYIPPIYKTLMRVVDMYGFVTVDTNRYSVPERLCGQQVEVHKSLESITVYSGNRKVAQHERCLDKRDTKITLKGHHTPFARKIQTNSSCWQEKGLIGEFEILNDYIKQLKRRSHGRGTPQMQRLLNLKQTYPSNAFEKAIRTAHHYGLYDLNRLENLILSYVAGDFFNLEINEE